MLEVVCQSVGHPTIFCWLLTMFNFWTCSCPKTERMRMRNLEVWKVSDYQMHVCRLLYRDLCRVVRACPGTCLDFSRGIQTAFELLKSFDARWNHHDVIDKNVLVAAKSVASDQMVLPESVGHLNPVLKLYAVHLEEYNNRFVGLDDIHEELPKACYMVPLAEEIKLRRRLLLSRMAILWPEKLIAKLRNGNQDCVQFLMLDLVTQPNADFGGRDYLPDGCFVE
jgi:hypothetical protein